MPMPKFDIFSHNPSEAHIKSNCIIRELYKLGYDVGNERDAIRIIEKEGVDKFHFDYPYDSFEEFKCHVLDGEFDVESHLMTDEEREQWNKDVKEGRVWIMY